MAAIGSRFELSASHKEIACVFVAIGFTTHQAPIHRAPKEGNFTQRLRASPRNAEPNLR
jgi:hypothetical protein